MVVVTRLPRQLPVYSTASDMNVHQKNGPAKCFYHLLLPARASEQGNVTGLVSMYIYIYMCTKKIVIERTRDLIYLKFVATDFSPKITSPSTGENSGDSA